MRHGRLGRTAAGLAVMMTAATGAAPPLTGPIPPVGPPPGPLRPVGPLGPVKIDPALLDRQMSFDFTHAETNKEKTGISLAFPGPPTATAQGAILTLFVYGIVYPAGAQGGSTAHMVYTATNKLATADFRSNAFELAKRRAVVLDWSGYFEQVNFPIQINLSFGQEQMIGSVIFDKGQVLVGPAGQETAIGTYVVDSSGKVVQHRLLIRADLVARSYTVRFEQGGHDVTSANVPFPPGTSSVPAGLQQVTARLTSPKPYVSGSYDLSRLALTGEPK